MRKDHNLDMTKGNVLKLVLIFSLPIFLGNLFQQMYSLVDTMVAGYNLGDQAIAAIGAVQAIDTMVINLAAGLSQGFAIILTMAIGAHDRHKTRKSIATIFRFCLNAAVLMTIATCVLMSPFLKLLKTPQDIFYDSLHYSLIVCLGITATMFYNMFASILRSFGNSVMALVFLICSSLLNIVLDVLFVAGFHWGLPGAAIATILAQGISAVLSGIYFVRNYREYLPTRADFKKDPALSKSMLSSGFGMAMMYTTVNIGTIIFQSAINSLGTLYITAHTASRKLMFMFMMPGSSLCSAMSTFVSQNWGAKDKKRIRKSIVQVMIFFEFLALAMILLAFVAGPMLVRLITGSNDTTMMDLAVFSIKIQIIFFPALEVLLLIRIVMQAMGTPAAPVIAAALELLVKALSTILVVPTYGFVAVCLTEPISWVVCAIYIAIHYFIKRKKLLYT